MKDAQIMFSTCMRRSALCVFRAPLRRTPAQVHSHLMELRPLSVHETHTSPTPRPTHQDPQADNLPQADNIISLHKEDTLFVHV